MPLLPNLLSLDATELVIESVGERRRLRFAGTLANAGPGPLVLQPRGRGRCVPGEHAAHQLREHFGECSATRVQGISPGWVDIYGADLDGQWLMLPRTFIDGLACLDLAADPRGLVRETDETDNATTTAVRVRGDRAQVVASTTRCA